MSARARLAGSLAFAATMGFFEAAVVVYLRRLWELGEIQVAPASLSNVLIRTELLREAASLGMIASVAWLAGRRGVERFAHAAVIFGTWDLLYYVYLRLLIGWPASLLDWDVLFLIPKTWVGPVLAAVLVSAALVAGGVYLALREDGPRPVTIAPPAWVAGVIGGSIVIVSFLMPEAPRSLTDQPAGFSWTIFLAGLGIGLAGFAHILWASSRDDARLARDARLGAQARPPFQGERRP